jgi:hypothetical protein
MPTVRLISSTLLGPDDDEWNRLRCYRRLEQEYNNTAGVYHGPSRLEYFADGLLPCLTKSYCGFGLLKTQ